MKFLTRKTLFVFFVILTSALSHAQTLPISIVPNGTLPSFIYTGSLVSAEYSVTNNTGASVILSVKTLPANVSQVISSSKKRASVCGDLMMLPARAQCILSLSVSGPVSSTVQNNIWLCLPNGISCFSTNYGLQVIQSPATLVSISVMPSNQTLLLGETQQYSATGVYSDSTELDLTNYVSWSTDPINIATIDARGLASTVGIGTSSITARSNAASGYITGSTNLTVQNPSPPTTIAVTSPSSNLMIIPVTYSGDTNPTSLSLTIHNTGASTAHNVHVALPDAWTGVVQNANNCTTIVADGSCIVTFSSTSPYLAQSGISVTGDNITNPPTIALAFAMNGYLVYSLPSPGTASVVAVSDIDYFYYWDPSCPRLLQQACQPTGATDLIDGAANTQKIVSSLSDGGDFAARPCYAITTDNTGSISEGTWYLPAICEMDVGWVPGCPSLDGSIHDLVQLNFLTGYNMNVPYWSSSENQDDPTYAWKQIIYPDNCDQEAIGKGSDNAKVRCVRAINYG
jgi:hypothetical protein